MVRDQTGLVRPVEQLLHGQSTGLAVVQRPVVDVHADEPVGADGVVFDATRVARRVAERLFAIAQGVVDALGQQAAQPYLQRIVQVPSDAVGAQRQRAAGLAGPPRPEVDDALQALVAEGQLPLVDHHAGVDLSGLDDVEDAVERHDLRLHLRVP